MRWMFYMLLILGMASPALAADYDLPILRGSSQPPAPVVTVGPATFTRWSGFYVGGDVSYNNANVDFTNATAPLHNIGPARHAGGATIHAFPITGNWQRFFQRIGRWRFSWLQYSMARSYPWRRSELHAHELARYGVQYSLLWGHRPQLRVPSWQCYAPSRSATRHRALRSYRLRSRRVFAPDMSSVTCCHMGSSAWWSEGRLQCIGKSGPDVHHGVAFPAECVGYPLTCFPAPGKTTRCSGATQSVSGLDWALTQNFFLRGEFEFVQFAPVSSINVPIVNGRVGAGYKF